MNFRAGLGVKIPLISMLLGLLSALLLVLVLWAAGLELPAASRQPGWFVASAGALGLVFGLAASLLLHSRLAKLHEVSQAWLLGNLHPRLPETPLDELGQLAADLNQLARQLQHDEQDLAELRQRETRLTDQVRALSILEERNRLARELHDSVKQHLFSLSMMAAAAADFEQARATALPGELAEILRQMKVTAKTAQQELNRLIEDLHPPSLAERGLAAALNDATLVLGAREHLLIYLNVQGNDALIPLAVSEALYRVAQEALANVVRHARATRVEIALHVMPEQVLLRLCDDGVGFDTRQPRHGMGTANMQERLLLVNGRLRIESQVGRGTAVTAEVSLSRSPHLSTDLQASQGERMAAVENWPWLGQKLVIPVGQAWPWLPADEVYLLQPLIEPEKSPLHLRARTGLLGLGRGFQLRPQGKSAALLPFLFPARTGYHWHSQGAEWRFSSPDTGQPRRWVLHRNRQPLAAVQRQGRQMETWDEIIYAGHGYRLACRSAPRPAFTLTDECQQELLQATWRPDLQIELKRAIPLPLLLLAALRINQEKVKPPTAPITEETQTRRIA